MYGQPLRYDNGQTFGKSILLHNDDQRWVANVHIGARFQFTSLPSSDIIYEYVEGQAILTPNFDFLLRFLTKNFYFWLSFLTNFLIFYSRIDAQIVPLLSPPVVNWYDSQLSPKTYSIRWLYTVSIPPAGQVFIIF